ncbi:MAG: hypothetical protein RL748_3225, partial [Pseudomonadota bacterium]
YLFELMQHSGVTTLHFVPSMLEMYLQIHARPQANDQIGETALPHRSGWPGSVRQVLCSGEALSFALQEKFFAATQGPDGQATIALHNLYGPTEAAIDVSHWHCQPGLMPNLGYPVANLRLYVVDANLQAVPPGVAGELLIAGVGVGRGYWQRPALSAERFIGDPFADSFADSFGDSFAQVLTEFDASAQRAYRTGDLAKWRRDGSIDYLGRCDFQVKLRGQRLELGEIEARLRACPGVRDALVVLHEERLLAYVLADVAVNAAANANANAAVNAGSAPLAGLDSLLDSRHLRQQLARDLPEYMLPSHFMVLDHFPLSSNGKLDRRALPQPDFIEASQHGYQAPMPGWERAIADIWQSLLQYPQVGRDDDFFALGGHSLLAVQCIAALRSQHQIEIGLRQLFNAPTLQAFALLVAQQQAEQAISVPLQVASRSLPLPLSWGQQRLWFISHFDRAASRAYHMPTALRLSGQLQPDALRRALQRVVERHEVLRTRFVQDGGQVWQVIDANTGFDLQVQDLSAMPGHEQAFARQRLSVDLLEQAFDLENGPLLRAQLLRLAADQHVLLLVQHHIVSDAWSVALLLQEVIALYAAFSDDLPDPLPPLTLQYADYAVWQRQVLSGPRWQAQLEYWQQTLRGAPALLELPLDYPRGPQQDVAGAQIRFDIDASAMLVFCQAHGLTLFQFLLASWALLMARLSGQSEVVIGTPVAHRPQRELEKLLGYFVNTLALRINCDLEQDLDNWLQAVREQVLAGFEQQDLPFEQVVEALNPGRDTSYSPIFQTMLALNNTPGAAGVAGTSGAAGLQASLPDLRIAAEALEFNSSQFDLLLALQQDGNRLHAQLGYRTALFEASTMRRWIAQWQTLLASIVAAAPERQPLHRLRWFDNASWQRVVSDFNRPQQSMQASSQLLHHQFEARVQQQPQAIALIWPQEDGSPARQLTYQQLNQRANQVAHALLAQFGSPW